MNGDYLFSSIEKPDILYCNLQCCKDIVVVVLGKKARLADFFLWCLQCQKTYGYFVHLYIWIWLILGVAWEWMHGYAQYLKKRVDFDMETNGKSCCMKYNTNSYGKSGAFYFPVY